jgi:ATP-dependent DNA helicase Q1
MLSFAAELEQCRKVHFAKLVPSILRSGLPDATLSGRNSRYFSTSSQLSIASWSTDETDAMARCGHCDNCTRAPETVDRKDMTTEAWQILKIAEAVQRDKGMLTLGMLADVARGSGGAAFDVRSGGRAAQGKEKKGVVDLDVVAHGKVELSKDVGPAPPVDIVRLHKD